MEIIYPLPDLSGSVCTGFVREEYWFKGNKKDGYCVLNLQTNGRDWHRFFFDYGTLFWQTSDALHEPNTTIHDMYHNPLVDEMARNGTLRGRSIEAMVPIDKGALSELQVRFSGGITLVLQEENDFCTFAVINETTV